MGSTLFQECRVQLIRARALRASPSFKRDSGDTNPEMIFYFSCLFKVCALVCEEKQTVLVSTDISHVSLTA